MRSPSDVNVSKPSTNDANAFDIWLLGIFIVIGGQVFSWNLALLAGFWEGFFGMMLTGVGYLCLVLCMSEMTSALPFSGGSYGFVRVCVGPFFGYLVGCCEALQNMAYVSSSVIPFGEMLTAAFGTPTSYEPIYWTFFFVTAIAINIAGGKTFWYFIRFLAIISLIIQLVYVGGTAQYGDFNRFTNSSVSSYSFNGYKFMLYFPINSWYYIGVESLPLACNDCDKPQIQLPIGMVACIVTLVLTAISIFFTTTSQYPGTAEVGQALLPLNYGFQRLFPLNNADVTWLAIPSTYATGFGFMFVYGRQMCSMARSGLLPTIFKLRTKSSRSPYAALIIGSIISLIGVLSIYYTDESLLLDVFSICILASYTVYSFALFSYIIFKRRYSSLNRDFINPLGISSAIIGIGIFTIGIISILGYHNGHHYIPILVFVIYVILCSCYYLFLGYKKQQLSEEEQKILFRAYVINVNSQNRNRKNHYRAAADQQSVSVSSYNAKTTSRIHPENRPEANAVRNDVEIPSDSVLPDISHAPTSFDDLESPKDTDNNTNIHSSSIQVKPTRQSPLTPQTHNNDHKIVPITEQKDTERSENLVTNSLDEQILFTPSSDRKSGGGSSGRKALAQSMKAMANELQILPFMDGMKRNQYETFAIVEYITGEFETDTNE